MDMNLFIDRLLAAAKEAGITAAEVYCVEGSSFRARAMEQEIKDYQVSASCGLNLRGLVDGRMGYASTQAFDEAAIEQLIEGVKESALLTETDEQDEIFAGEAEYPTVDKQDSDLTGVSAQAKLDACLAMERAALAADSRVWKVQGASLSTGTSRVTLRNSYGLNLTSEGSLCVAYTSAIAKEGDSTGTGVGFACGSRFDGVDPEKIGREAAEEAVGQLHGDSVPAGEYRIIFRNDAMSDLLSTFEGVFSAENAQQKLSLLAGREGTEIASPVVTLMDDPLLPGGLATCPFDAEGSASRTKAVIDHGVLTTLLHSRKTARKQGVTTTGNASRAGYTAPVRVAPTNFFFQPGDKDLAGLMADMGDGLVITELNGLHAGANAVSGDFSLLSKGYLVKDGKRAGAVEQITVAGNFYAVLKNIRAVGSDLLFFGSSTGSPSVDAGTLNVAGK